MSSTAAGTILDSQPLRSGKRPLAGAGLAIAAPEPAQLMILACAFCSFAAAAFAPQLLWDGDTLWHIATGDWMIAHHQIVRADPFSFTVPGHPWTNLEYLSELVMAPIYAAGGWSGIHIGFGLALGATTWIQGEGGEQRQAEQEAAVQIGPEGHDRQQPQGRGLACFSRPDQLHRPQRQDGKRQQVWPRQPALGGAGEREEQGCGAAERRQLA